MEFEKLKEIIVDVLNVGEEDVKMESTFVDDLGADSLDIFQIIMGIEEAFDIEIENEDAEKIVTVGDAVEQIDKHLALPYTVKVMDYNKNEEVDIKIKSFKKILAIIKNSKRYNPMDQILRFKPGFKVTDLIDISGCKNLTELNIYNSFALLKITKPGKAGTDIGSEKSPQSTRVDDYVISVRKISKYADI